MTFHQALSINVDICSKFAKIFYIALFALLYLSRAFVFLYGEAVPAPDSLAAIPPLRWHGLLDLLSQLVQWANRVLVNRWKLKKVGPRLNRINLRWR